MRSARTKRATSVRIRPEGNGIVCDALPSCAKFDVLGSSLAPIMPVSETDVSVSAGKIVTLLTVRVWIARFEGCGVRLIREETGELAQTAPVDIARAMNARRGIVFMVIVPTV